MAIPDEFERIICGGIGIRDKSDLACEFVTWLETNHEPGVLGKPRHMRDRAYQTDTMLTDLIADRTQHTKGHERPDCRPAIFRGNAARRRGCR